MDHNSISNEVMFQISGSNSLRQIWISWKVPLLFQLITWYLTWN